MCPNQHIFIPKSPFLSYHHHRRYLICPMLDCMSLVPIATLTSAPGSIHTSLGFACFIKEYLSYV